VGNSLTAVCNSGGTHSCKERKKMERPNSLWGRRRTCLYSKKKEAVILDRQTGETRGGKKKRLRK